MDISTAQPPGFDTGVYIVKVALSPEEVALSGDQPFTFEIPELQKWFFRQNIDPGTGSSSYSHPRVRDVSGSLSGRLGRFEHGLWEIIVQSNGVTEGNNPITLSEVLQSVQGNIQARLDQMRQ